MRWSRRFLALCLAGSSLAAVAGSGSAAWAAEVRTALFTKSELGPQAAGAALAPGDLVRLNLTADESLTLSVIWHPASGEPRALLNDTRLGKGQTVTVPGDASGDAGWIALDDSAGLPYFQIFTTDAAGNVEERTLTALVLEPESAAADQRALSAFLAVPADATPAKSFAGDGYRVFKSGFAAQLAKVPPEPPTFASTGAALFKQVADGVVLVLTNDGLGTGSIISDQGEILTNWHVVKGYDVVGIVFRPPPGTPLSQDMIVLADVVKQSPTQDLVLLKLQQPPPKTPILPIGDISEIDIGDEVHAVGHPRGESWTYTRGYVSQIRDHYAWDIGLGVQHAGEVIQTQTPINPGNSGGPLLDDAGHIVGVNSFSASDMQGLNFAVSVTEVKAFLANPEPPQPTPVAGGPTPQPPASGPPAAQPEPQFYELDTDNDGKTDTYAADTNGDGLFDLLVIDENGDGTAEYLLVDRDFNGVIDARMEPMQDDKQAWVDVWMLDDNEDGTYEVYGIDHDRDGTVDEWHKA